MCLICIEFQKQRMTLAEARRAYSEMVPKIGPEHAREVRDMLDDAERNPNRDAADDAQGTDP